LRNIRSTVLPKLWVLDCIRTLTTCKGENNITATEVAMICDMKKIRSGKYLLLMKNPELPTALEIASDSDFVLI